MFSVDEAKQRYHKPTLEYVFEAINQAVDERKNDCVVYINSNEVNYIVEVLTSDEYNYDVSYGFNESSDQKILVIKGWI